MSRQGFADYVVTLRKAGENDEPITHTPDELPVTLWQRYASPVWMDINFSNTLNAKAARENEDERHVCPMALDLIERAITLWSNHGDVVFDPFSGIGSTGYQAIKMGRKFIGSELKAAYFVQACKNLHSAKSQQQGLF